MSRIYGSGMLAIVLLIGSALWIVSELLEIASGGFSDLGNIVNAGGLVAIAVGIWSIQTTPERIWKRVGGVGMAVVAFGLVLFAAMLLTLVGTEARSGAEVSDTLLFRAAAGLTALGTLLLGTALIGGARHRMAGAILVICTAVAIAVPVAGLPIQVQSVANILIAGTMAVCRLRLTGSSRWPIFS